MNRKPKIIQILMAPNDSIWQGRLLGLGSDGVVYALEQHLKNQLYPNEWVKAIDPISRFFD